MQLTARDEDILATLASKVRLISDQQVTRTWWCDPPSPAALKTAARRLARLVQAGHLVRLRRASRPELRLTAPLATWRPGGEPPAFATIATLGRERFQEPVRSTVFYIASDATARRIGGATVRRPRLGETTHDLHVTTVYLHFRSNHPGLAARWRAEWLTPPGRRRGRSHPKTPDAVIERERRSTAIEFVGHYTPEKLAGFHRHCAERRLAYELW